MVFFGAWHRKKHFASFHSQPMLLLLKEVEKHAFTQKWLDHLLLMTSYLKTIVTDHHFQDFFEDRRRAFSQSLWETLTLSACYMWTFFIIIITAKYNYPNQMVSVHRTLPPPPLLPVSSKLCYSCSLIGYPTWKKTSNPKGYLVRLSLDWFIIHYSLIAFIFLNLDHLPQWSGTKAL